TPEQPCRVEHPVVGWSDRTHSDATRDTVRRDHGCMHNQPVILSSFDHADLPVVQAWFCDPETRRFLGGPDWPALMLERAERGLGRVFRGAVQTGAYRYLARSGGRAWATWDCGTFDRCTVYGREGT